MTSPLSAPQSNSLSPSHRLRKPKEFRRVYDQGVRYPSTYFVAFCLRRSTVPSDGEPPVAGPRVGFTIPKAVGKAVARNRIRRRFRELMRHRLGALAPEWDIVLNPRRSALLADFSVLGRDLDKVLARCSA